MAINNSPVLKRERRKRKVTSERINNILHIDHADPKKWVGEFERDPKTQTGRGLNIEQITKVAEHLNIGVLKASFLSQPHIDASKWIYPNLESSCPTILGIQRPPFGTDKWLRHVVTVLGHTLNTDSWGPEAKSGYQQLTSPYYHSTSDWVDHFLMGDDNYGMYRTLPTNELHHVIMPQFNANIHPSMAITFVPQQVTGRPIESEVAAFIFIKLFVSHVLKIHPGIRQLKWFGELVRTNTFNEKVQTKLTFRTFWSTSKHYLEHLEKVEDRDGNRLGQSTIKKIKGTLPDLVWVTEISLPNLYCGNKAKLGDVLVDIGFTGENPSVKDVLRAVKFSWLPGVSVIGKRHSLYTWPLVSYIPLQRSAYVRGSDKMEW